jgi:hypothetical protein
MDGVDEGDGIRCIAVSAWGPGMIVTEDSTCSLDVKAVEGSSCVRDVIHPLMTQNVRTGDSGRKRRTSHLLGLRYHHMAIHENPWYTLRNTRKDGGTWRVRIEVKIGGKIMFQ